MMMEWCRSRKNESNYCLKSSVSSREWKAAGKRAGGGEVKATGEVTKSEETGGYISGVITRIWCSVD